MEQLVLSVDQMNYLVHRLGVSNNSASAIWVAQYTHNGEFVGYNLQSKEDKEYASEDIPAFTLVNILWLLPKGWLFSPCTDGYKIAINTKEGTKDFYGKTELETVYKALCLCLRKHYIR